MNANVRIHVIHKTTAGGPQAGGLCAFGGSGLIAVSHLSPDNCVATAMGTK